MGIFDKFKKYNQSPKQNIPQPVYGIPDTIGQHNDIESKEDESILFYHSNKPSCGKAGDDGGYSISIHVEGRVLRERYAFGTDKIVARELIALSDDEMLQIVKLITKHSNEIEACAEKSYSCCDGNMYKFIFGSKVIEGDNSLRSNHLLFAIANQIMHIVTASKRKYNQDPAMNMPRMVYAPPDVMRKMQEEKYDVDPKQNAPQKVYGTPRPRRKDT